MAAASDEAALSTAFWELTDEQIALLHPHGQVVTTEAGPVLFQQGDPTCDFYVVLDGSVELVEPTAGTPRSLGLRHGREIVGEMNLLNEDATYLTAVVQQPGTVCFRCVGGGGPWVRVWQRLSRWPERAQHSLMRHTATRPGSMKGRARHLDPPRFA